MADILIQNAGKAFGELKVLKDISIDIKDGEFLVLVGPSGCGKSTLLRMVAGLESFSSGGLSIGGRNVTDLPPKDRDIAMVFQNYALYPHMTVERNMGFSLEISKVDKQTRKQQVDKAAGILGLEHLLQRYPRQLSGGQRQRVAMGRAIVRDPAVFLFDEPLSNLDAQLRVEMRSEIKRLHQRLGATIIYVTHDQVEAMTMADRIALMNKGAVEQLGSPLELYDRPANAFVARFIGSPPMNLIAGRLRKNDGRATFITENGDSLPLDMAAAPDAAEKELLLGVRPEYFLLTEQGLPVTVTLVEPLGSETQLLCQYGDAAMTVLLRDRVSVRQGDRIHLAPEPGRPLLFDSSTGQAVIQNS